MISRELSCCLIFSAWFAAHMVACDNHNLLPFIVSPMDIRRKTAVRTIEKMTTATMTSMIVKPRGQGFLFVL
jgi:hypothetical protein